MVGPSCGLCGVYSPPNVLLIYTHTHTHISSFFILVGQREEEEEEKKNLRANGYLMRPIFILRLDFLSSHSPAPPLTRKTKKKMWNEKKAKKRRKWFMVTVREKSNDPTFFVFFFFLYLFPCRRLYSFCAPALVFHIAPSSPSSSSGHSRFNWFTTRTLKESVHTCVYYRLESLFDAWQPVDYDETHNSRPIFLRLVMYSKKLKTIKWREKATDERLIRDN